jgi:transposase-like protein
MQKKKFYTPEFKAQIAKEVHDVGDMSAVAKAHQLALVNVYRWTTGKSRAKKQTSTPSPIITPTIIDLKKKLADADLEIRVLKELLKKTNQAWLKD